MGEEFIRKLVINGKSRSTHENYLRQMSKLALHYKRTPLEIEVDELEEYLYYLIQKDTDALSSYKHLVYGLRISEVTNLLIKDVDLDRKQLHIRQSKNNKDRYVTMSSHAVRGIKKHLAINNPRLYLFDSYKRKGIPISKTRIRALLKEALSRTDIRKDISVHSLRHTYATHQLEAGQNIMVLKESLGHEAIASTLMYLHIAQLDTVRRFGCMESLYSKSDGQ